MFFDSINLGPLLTSFLPRLAFLEGIGAMEMILVAVVGLLLFGGKGLPDMARTVGKVIREFKKATQGVEEEVRRVIHDEPAPAPKARSRVRPQPAVPPTAPLPISNASSASSLAELRPELPLPKRPDSAPETGA